MRAGLAVDVPARRITRERSAHAGSATFGLPSAPVPRWWIDPQVRALDRLDQLAGRLDHARRRQRLGRASSRRARRPSRRSRPAGGTAARPGTPTAPCSCPGWSTSTHRKRVSLTACLSPRGAARTAGATNTSSPRSACRAASVEQRLQPVISAGLPAGQEVIGAPAGGDLKPAVAPGAGGDLDQPVGVLVQHARAAGRGGAPGASAPAKTRPSASRTRQRNPSRARVGAVPDGGGGGCGHRLLPAQVWARRPSRPATGACSADGGQVVAGDRLGLRAAVLVARRARRRRAPSRRRRRCRAPASRRRRSRGRRARAGRRPRRGSSRSRVSLMVSSFASVGFARRGVRSAASSNRAATASSAPGLLGEQPGQRPVERDERGRGVQQRAGGVLERGRALRRTARSTRALAAPAPPAPRRRARRRAAGRAPRRSRGVVLLAHRHADARRISR